MHLAFLFLLALSACNYYEQKAVAGPVDPASITYKDVKDQVLGPYCIKCHGGTAGLFFDTYAGVLKALSPGDEKSPLCAVLQDGSMPPAGNKPSADLAKMVCDWVKAGALENGGGVKPPDPPVDPPIDEDETYVASCDAKQPAVKVKAPARVSYAEVLHCINNDVSAVKLYDAQYFRYLYLHHIYNLGDAVRFKRAKWAVGKMVKSLNRTVSPIKAVPVDDWGVVYRVDTRELGLSPAEYDKLILTIFPYGISFFDAREFAGYEVNIAQRTLSPLAYVRADWFVNQTAQAPLYYDLLNLPHTLGELEAQLFPFSTYSGFYPTDIKIAGIRTSGVAHYNRIIHRRPLRYSINGVNVDTHYWITFDVDSLVRKEQNIFAFPFGPRWSSKLFGNTDLWYEQNLVFDHAAAEVIFGSPSGGLVFYIGDGKGRRQNEVPIEVADDRKNTPPHIGKVPYSISPAAACMRCHTQINPYSATELLAHVENTAGFTKAQVDELRYFSESQAELNKALKEHNDIYDRFISSVSTDPAMKDPAQEPVWSTSKEYEEYVSVQELAEEIAMSASEFKSCLFHSPDLARVLSLSDYDHGFVSRDTVERHFGTIVRECNVGKQLVFNKVVVVDKCRVFFKNTSGYTVKFNVGYGTNPIQAVRLDHGRDQVFEFTGKLAGEVSGLQFWNGRMWVSYANKWATACQNYSFQYRQGRVSLFSN